MPDAVKDPTKVRAGQAGANKRWGGQRILRLDQLTPEQRRLVLALVDAAKEAPAGDESASAQEVDRDAVDHTTASRA